MTVSTEAIWHSLGDSLRGYILGKVSDPTVAEDLLQDVFLRIHQKIDTLTHQERVAGWVYRIAHNAVVDHYRRFKPKEVESVELSDLPADPTDTFSQDLTASVRSIIRGLPAKYREVLEMVELRGATQREAAEAFGLTPSGIKSRVHRGREMIRAALLDCCHLEFDQRGKVMDWEPRTQCKSCHC